jgi:hypothetical protein
VGLLRNIKMHAVFQDFRGKNMVTDSGIVFDGSLKGGRLRILCQI